MSELAILLVIVCADEPLKTKGILDHQTENAIAFYSMPVEGTCKFLLNVSLLCTNLS